MIGVTATLTFPGGEVGGAAQWTGIWLPVGATLVAYDAIHAYQPAGADDRDRRTAGRNNIR